MNKVELFLGWELDRNHEPFKAEFCSTFLDALTKITDGYTMFDCVRYWKGRPEKSVHIEILTDDAEKVKEIRECARDFLMESNQESAVLISEVTEFVENPKKGK
jgi:hypothetical protein